MDDGIHFDIKICRIGLQEINKCKKKEEKIVRENYKKKKNLKQQNKSMKYFLNKMI